MRSHVSFYAECHVTDVDVRPLRGRKYWRRADFPQAMLRIAWGYRNSPSSRTASLVGLSSVISHKSNKDHRKQPRQHETTAPITHQSSTLNPQPTTLNQQPSTLNQQPTTNNQQPSTINHQPSTINHQPSTINHQPSTIEPSPIDPAPLNIMWHSQATSAN